MHCEHIKCSSMECESGFAPDHAKVVTFKVAV
jgi:hypothetical protein